MPILQMLREIKSHALLLTPGPTPHVGAWFLTLLCPLTLLQSGDRCASLSRRAERGPPCTRDTLPGGGVLCESASVPLSLFTHCQARARARGDHK